MVEIYSNNYRTDFVNPFFNGYLLARLSKIQYLESYLIFRRGKAAIEMVIEEFKY
jgi:hypothetical protein